MSTLNVGDVNMSGRIDLFRGADLASAATTGISNTSGNYVHISGTTTITSLGTAPQAGVTRTLYFEDSLTLTHGTFLFLPLGQNIITQAGDIATFVADVIIPGTIWRMISYTNAQLVNSVGGQYLNRQVLNSGTTYTPTYGTRKARIQGWAAGGAGGSASAVAGGANGGGAAGGYFEYWLDITAHPSTFPTYAYTIGAGGAVNAGAAGSAGGNTTFVDGLTTVTAFGGPGGSATAGTAAIKFTSGGVAPAVSTNGHVNGGGVPGGTGLTSTVATVGCAGDGASTSLGGGGQGGRYSAAVAAPGNPALANTGSGGGGGGTGAALVGAGGAGAAGRIIITEFR